ncbi:MAG: hypothetical protein KME18_02750 [Phormidium tanganyikae FI6-MK23]|jgi:hypothetical protein|nr:hypothetical protein [Phormidium tanganyikae FI6-MK23]
MNLKERVETRKNLEQYHDQMLAEWSRIIPNLDCKTLEEIKRLANEYALSSHPNVDRTEQDFLQWDLDYEL